MSSRTTKKGKPGKGAHLMDLSLAASGESLRAVMLLKQVCLAIRLPYITPAMDPAGKGIAKSGSFQRSPGIREGKGVVPT